MQPIPPKAKFWMGAGIIILLLGDLMYLNVSLISIQHNLFGFSLRGQKVSLSRQNSFGNFSSTPLAKSCLKLKAASEHVGETQCIEGKLDHLYTSKKGTVFLNFCPSYQTCPFQAVIFASDAPKFSQLSKLKGQLVQMTGLITTYQGKAEMIIHGPNQIKVK